MNMRVEDEDVCGKMGKKFKKRKRNLTNDLEEVTDSTAAAPTGLKNSLKFNEQKYKKKLEVGGDIEHANLCGEDANSEGYVKVNGDLQKEKGRKKKRRKGILELGEEVTDCLDAKPLGLENSFKSSKGYKKLKASKKHEVSGDIVLDAIIDEAHRKDYVGADSGLQTEKDQEKKKTKKRNLESGEDKITLSDKMEGEEDRSLQIKDGLDPGNASELKPTKNKKKRNGDHRKKDGNNAVSFSMENFEGENAGNDGVVKGSKKFEKEDVTETENWEDRAREKKNKKMNKDNKDSDAKGKRQARDCKKVQSTREDHDEKKKRKREKKKGKDDLVAGLQEVVTEGSGNESIIFEDEYLVESEGNACSTINKVPDAEAKNGNIGKRKKTKSIENGSGIAKTKRKSKKVTFSGHVEVFPSSHNPSTEKDENQEEDLVRGKRFSREEDAIVKEAVFNYIKVHNLGEEGLDMVLHCKSHPVTKNCWKEIGAAIPYRPYSAIYYRAHVLFERAERRSWTEEEYDIIRKSQEKHGNNWKMLADDLGKHRFHVKDTWRRIKLPNLKRGHWSQEEYQTLFDLVNLDLQSKAFEEKKSKHGMLRDNICWGAISDKMSTRLNATCCLKWYNQLTSSLVAEGKWADTDDYRLLHALFNLDACCIEDVDWDDLLDHRSGDVCRKRWNQMLLHIGKHGNKSFAEQVEILAKRYCPHLIEAREAWENKPVVP